MKFLAIEWHETVRYRARIPISDELAEKIDEEGCVDGAVSLMSDEDFDWFEKVGDHYGPAWSTNLLTSVEEREVFGLNTEEDV